MAINLYTWMYVVMPKAYSKDLREKIVSAYESGSETIEEIAYRFSVGISTVSKYLKKWRETGDLTPLKSPGRPALLDSTLQEQLKELVLAKPDATLEEYCTEFKEKTNVEIKRSTLWNACNNLDIRRKKNRSTPVSESQ